MMTRQIAVLVFLVLMGLFQAHAEEKYELEEEIFTEIEASGTDVAFPGDDEDMEIESGSGYTYIDIHEEEITDMTTLTTTTKFVEGGDFEGEPELTDTTLPPKVKVAPQPHDIEEIPTDLDTETKSVPDDTKEDTDHQPKAEEEDDVDVDVNLAEDNSESSFTGNSQFITVVAVGVSVGLLFAVCVIALLVYRLRKKDEGSYALEESKRLTGSPDYPSSSGQEYFA